VRGSVAGILGIDSEVVELCDAINALPGLETYESCFGHGSEKLHIALSADRRGALPPLLYALSACHSGAVGWEMTVMSDCAMSPATFVVRGPVGGAGRVEIAKELQSRR